MLLSQPPQLALLPQPPRPEATSSLRHIRLTNISQLASHTFKMNNFSLLSLTGPLDSNKRPIPLYIRIEPASSYSACVVAGDTLWAFEAEFSPTLLFSIESCNHNQSLYLSAYDFDTYLPKFLCPSTIHSHLDPIYEPRPAATTTEQGERSLEREQQG